MSKKTKKAPPVPSEGTTQAVDAQAPEPKPAPKPESKGAPKKALPRRPAMLSGSKPKPRAASLVAEATGTSKQVFSALKAAYGWTDRTKLTRAEFLRKRDAWLQRPASEV